MPKIVEPSLNGKHKPTETQSHLAAFLADRMAGTGVVPGGMVPVPGEECRDRRDRRDFLGHGIAAEVGMFLARYIVLPDEMLLVAAAWVVAAWLADLWDRFPHVAVTSPEKRCGKTRLLQLLELVTPNPLNTTNISPAAVYRVIEKHSPVTLFIDEAQALKRRGSEASEVMCELLSGGIDRNAVVIRCGGEGNQEVVSFRVYSPKVIALIGELDTVLADRCLPIAMKRKTDADVVEQYRSRIVGPIGTDLRDVLEAWTAENKQRIADVYDHLEPFPIANDRMAELLMPLQAVLEVDDKVRLPILERYSQLLDEKDRQAERMSPGVRLLVACKEIFLAMGTPPLGLVKFLATKQLIERLTQRAEEPWATYCRGEPITAEALANLLRPYGIQSERTRDQKQRGYFALRFQEAWASYTPEKAV